METLELKKKNKKQKQTLDGLNIRMETTEESLGS